MKCIAVFKSLLLAIVVLNLWSLCPGQTEKEKQYDKNGVSFSYAEEWTVLGDKSSGDPHELNIADATTDAQILIIVSKRRVDSKNPMADLKKQSVEPWLGRMIEGYEGSGMKVQREPATSEIAGQPVEGARLTFELDRQKGIGEAFWTVLDKRLVLTYFLRPERTTTKAAVGWDVIRKSLKVAPIPKLEPVK